MARENEQTVPLSITILVALATYFFGTITIELLLGDIGSFGRFIMAPGVWFAKLFSWGAYVVPFTLLYVIKPILHPSWRRPTLILGPLVIIFLLTLSLWIQGVTGEFNAQGVHSGGGLLLSMYAQSSVTLVHWILFFLMVIEVVSEYLLYTTVYMKGEAPAVKTAKKPVSKLFSSFAPEQKQEKSSVEAPVTGTKKRESSSLDTQDEKGKIPKLHLSFPKLPEVPRLHSPDFIPGLKRREESDAFDGDRRVEFLERRKRKSTPPIVEYLRDGEEEEEESMPVKPLVTTSIFPASGVSEQAAIDSVAPETSRSEKPEFHETIAFPRRFANNYIGSRDEALYRQSFEDPSDAGDDEASAPEVGPSVDDENYWSNIGAQIVVDNRDREIRKKYQQNFLGDAPAKEKEFTPVAETTSSDKEFSAEDAVAYGEQLFNLTRSKVQPAPESVALDDISEIPEVTPVVTSTKSAVINSDEFVSRVIENPSDDLYTPPVVEVVEQEEPSDDSMFVETLSQNFFEDDDEEDLGNPIIEVDAGGVTGKPVVAPVVESVAPSFTTEVLPTLMVDGDESTEIPDVDTIMGDLADHDTDDEDDKSYPFEDTPAPVPVLEREEEEEDDDFVSFDDDTDDPMPVATPPIKVVENKKNLSFDGEDVLVVDEVSRGNPETLEKRENKPADPPPPPKPVNLYKNYRIPAEDLLTPHEDNEYWVLDSETEKRGEDLIQNLADFNIDAELTGIQKGPVVTMFEIQPAPGVKVSKIASLQDNIAMELQASRVRIVAPIPGKKAVGVEVPNTNRSLVSFIEMFKPLEEQSKKMALPVVLGKDITGDPQLIDLTKTPHLLIAGATGAGKSVCVNSLICSILLKRSPREVKLIMIDPKRVELNIYNDIPHMLTPVITESKKALRAIQYGIFEMERRYSLLQAVGGRNIAEYNNKVVKEKLATEKLPHIVIIVDEFADLMTTTGKELENYITRLAAMARAVGIHMVLATQRPSADVITGLIKANIPSRVAFMVTSNTDSRIIIDQPGAEKLLGQGDMLFASSWNPYPVRMQGVFLSEDEVGNICEYVKTLGEPEYLDDSIFEDEEDEASLDFEDEDREDPVFYKALEIVRERNGASASYLQRRLKIGYNRAARLVEQMESFGIIGPPNGSKPREFIGIPEEFLEQME